MIHSRLRHIVKIDSLEWDEENIGHIARHGVEPDEVEDICYGINITRRCGKSRYIISGQTKAGRYLNIVVEVVSRAQFRPITAYPMNETQKNRYKRNNR